jgi:16S rRNA (guanine1207-N2)-methyltransferase
MSKRDRLASAVTAAEAVSESPLEGPVLLAGDNAPLADELSDLGVPHTTWQRFAFEGRPATAWPPEGPFASVVLRLPKSKGALHLLLDTLCRRLADGGELMVHGANDEGIKSAGKLLEERFEQVEAVRSKRHTRVWRASGLRRVPDEPVPEKVTAEVAGVQLDWLSWPGLFAHSRLDPATEALLRHLPPLEGKVLDFACGAGVIGQFVQRRDGLVPELSDVDALAVHMARVNVPGATVHLADGLPTDTGRYRFILSNPPLHRGKEATPGPMRALIDAAPRRLGRSGELWITTQGAMPLRGHLQDKFRLVDRVWRDRRFAVWRAVR